MRTFISLVAAAMLGGLLIAGCAAATPAPAPTTASAAPKPAEATKAPAAAAPTAAPAAPTAAPAKKVTYPEKGKTITLISPYAAGSTHDIVMKALQPPLEKELGAQIQMIYREGGGSQIGITELALARPDGYTLGWVSTPTINTMYLDKDRNTAFTRKSFQPLSAHSYDENLLAVRADSPFKTVQEYIAFAKANPGKLMLGATGYMGAAHLGTLQFEQVAGIEEKIVQFTGHAPNITALLGGHVDAIVTYTAAILPYVKSGQVRLLVTMGSTPNKFAPDVPTTESIGLKGIDSRSTRAFAMPTGAPKEIVDTLANAFVKAQLDPKHIEEMEKQFMSLSKPGPEEFAKIWDDWDTRVVPLMELARLKAK